MSTESQAQQLQLEMLQAGGFDGAVFAELPRAIQQELLNARQTGHSGQASHTGQGNHARQVGISMPRGGRSKGHKRPAAQDTGVQVRSIKSFFKPQSSRAQGRPQ